MRRLSRREREPVVVPLAALMGAVGLFAVYVSGGEADDIHWQPVLACMAVSAVFWTFYAGNVEGVSVGRAALVGAISPFVAGVCIPPVGMVEAWTLGVTLPWGPAVTVAVGAVTGVLMRAGLNTLDCEPGDGAPTQRRGLLRPPTEPWWSPCRGIS